MQFRVDDGLWVSESNKQAGQALSTRTKQWKMQQWLCCPSQSFIRCWTWSSPSLGWHDIDYILDVMEGGQSWSEWITNGFTFSDNPNCCSGRVSVGRLWPSSFAIHQFTLPRDIQFYSRSSGTWFRGNPQIIHPWIISIDNYYLGAMVWDAESGRQMGWLHHHHQHQHLPPTYVHSGIWLFGDYCYKM